MNILILHNLGNPDQASKSLLNLVFALKYNQPQNEYLYHDIDFELPDYVKDFSFDLIILDVTFLWARWGKMSDYENVLKCYNFVKSSDAVKIAFPQDDYDCCAILDNLFCDWKIDCVYTPLKNFEKELYPQFLAVGEIKKCHTGYIDNLLQDYKNKSFDTREIEIGYRAAKLPANFGRLGLVKSEIGHLVQEKCLNLGVNADIKIGLNHFINGNAWWGFINNCKFTLGSNSGSSILDPFGHVKNNVRNYLKINPNATFEEIEFNCFSGLDEKRNFTAISPRALEAGILESCQILVEGEYDNILSPWVDYIPLKSDASNFQEIWEATKDRHLVEQIIKNCKENLLSQKSFRIDFFTDTILSHAEKLKSKKKSNSSTTTEMKKLINRYNNDMQKKYKLLWQFRNYKTKFKKTFPLIDKLIHGTTT